MADNTTLNVGTLGDVIATDDVGPGVKHQLVKVEFGADGAATMVEASAPLPVELSDGTDTALVSAAGNLLTDGSTVTQPVSIAASTTVDAANDGTLNVQIGDGTETVLVNAAGELMVDEPNMISTNNSTTATLGISGNFTGTGDDVSDFSTVTIQLDSSHDSATDGMTFEFSTDDTNWDDSFLFTYTAADGARRFTFPVTAKFFRVNYTNGGTGQTTFRVQSILHRHAVTATIHRIVDSVDPDRSSTLNKSVVIAQAAGAGDFVPVQATASGNLKVAIEEISDGLDIGAGNAGAETQRVSISTDDVNLAILSGAVAAGQMQVDIVADGAGLALAASQLAAGHDVTVDNAAGTNSVPIEGDQAHSSVTIPNPVLAGAIATNAIEGITQVASLDVTYLTADLNGVLVTRPHTTLEEILSEHVTDTAGTSTDFSTFAAGAAGVHNYVTTISIFNSSATDGFVDFRDGAAGAIIFTAPAPTVGGSVINFPVPLKGAAATALAYDVSGALSTVHISIVGFQAQG